MYTNTSLKLDPDKLPTIANWCEEYKAQHASRWAPNTMKCADTELRRFALFCGMKDFTPKVVLEYQSEQHKRKCQPSTIYRAIEWPLRFIEWCEDMDYLPRHKFSKLLAKPQKPLKKVQVFTHEQYEKLKEISKGTLWHYAIIMAYRTGARFSDCCLMKWESVNFDGLYVNYVPFKSRKSGREALCPFDAGGDLHTVLLDLNESRHPHPMWKDYVCADLAMKYPTGGGDEGADKAFRLKFTTMCRKIGAAKGLTFHTLRHSFISRLIQGGASYPIGSQITGLCNPVVFSRYAKPDLLTLRKAIDNTNKNDHPPEEGMIVAMPAA